VAAFEDRDGPTEVVVKSRGGLWAAEYGHSPLDVVAWHGNAYPYKYDLARFNAVNTVSFDHPDPSIFTVLTSPSDTPGTANVDFVIFPPRWMVAEHTFRPPWFHRNAMSEFMGWFARVRAKRGGFVPGGASLHNAMALTGPTAPRTTRVPRHSSRSTSALPSPSFREPPPLRSHRTGMNSPQLEKDYDAV